MKKFLLIAALALTMLAAQAQSLMALTMHYDLKFDVQNHYVDVTLTCNEVKTNELLLKMPVWAPGYYIILDSPKHVCDFSAENAKGEKLEWTKNQKNGWLISTPNAETVIVKYRFFANQKSVGEADVKEQSAYLPGNEIYLYWDNHKDIPVTITINPSKNWSKIVTGLKAEGNNTFYASDFDVLVDSPIFCGNPEIREFDHEGHHYTLSIAEPKDVDIDRYVSELKKVISSTTKLMGDVPYDNYAFIWLENGRGGLEHRNSQACFVDDGLYSKNAKEHESFMNFATHEYYHLYNVKSIRPFELGPFNYDGECYTDQLWISEGLTVYYEFVLMLRSGLSTPNNILGEWSEYISDTENTEGQKHMSLARSSYDIWLNFFNKDLNSNDVRISYYVKGPVVGGMLDLAIRNNTKNAKSIDDLMRTLYNKYFKEQKRGFHPEEFWKEAESIAGYDLSDIKELVYTTKPIDYAKYLGYAGISINEKYELKPVEKPSKLQKEIRMAVFGL